MWTDRQSMDPLEGVPLTAILKSLLGFTAQGVKIPPRGSYSSHSFIVNGFLFYLRNLHKIRSSWQYFLDPLFQEVTVLFIQLYRSLAKYSFFKMITAPLMPSAQREPWGWLYSHTSSSLVLYLKDHFVILDQQNLLIILYFSSLISYWWGAHCQPIVLHL